MINCICRYRRSERWNQQTSAFVHRSGKPRSATCLLSFLRTCNIFFFLTLILCGSLSVIQAAEPVVQACAVPHDDRDENTTAAVLRPTPGSAPISPPGGAPFSFFSAHSLSYHGCIVVMVSLTGPVVMRTAGPVVSAGDSALCFMETLGFISIRFFFWLDYYLFMCCFSSYNSLLDAQIAENSAQLVFCFAV